MKSPNWKIILMLVALVVFIVAFSLIGYLQIDNKQDTGDMRSEAKETGATLMITVFNNTKSSKYNFKDSTALELLKLDNKVNTTYSKFGAFLNCINDICSTADYFWLYYVNGNLAAVGANEYMVKNNDIIDFRYGKLE